jgi:hypothetical protein
MLRAAIDGHLSFNRSASADHDGFFAWNLECARAQFTNAKLVSLYGFDLYCSVLAFECKAAVHKCRAQTVLPH